ncbi:hypothetical protein AVEN_126343-1 [Araneus ventricosus]|uniref:Uncharacterized protein n=1 Tax=Araneus ventricosus TaxID=182803 RepID=A0A4Y2NAK0_ARAVE|nr:hypothetical protein AVEN_126343-1 [Araneus ventricosus]
MHVSCQTLQQLQRATPTSKVVLIHDNTCPYNAVVTQQFKSDTSDHPADRQIFIPSPDLKNWLCGQSFQKNEDVQSSVKAHLTILEATFFEEIRNLVHRLLTA